MTLAQLEPKKSCIELLPDVQAIFCRCRHQVSRPNATIKPGRPAPRCERERRSGQRTRCRRWCWCCSVPVKAPIEIEQRIPDGEPALNLCNGFNLPRRRIPSGILPSGTQLLGSAQFLSNTQLQFLSSTQSLSTQLLDGTRLLFQGTQLRSSPQHWLKELKDRQQRRRPSSPISFAHQRRHRGHVVKRRTREGPILVLVGRSELCNVDGQIIAPNLTGFLCDLD